MILREIQQLIGGIYDVSVAHDVYDFLVTDRGCMPPAARANLSDEQLIVARESDAIAEAVKKSGLIAPAIPTGFRLPGE